MRINEDTVISFPTSPVVLVPYKSCHVPQYNKWMQSPTLLHLTASEPLSLEEEYENMKSWHVDPTKLTFILLDTSISPNFMAGDVNLYLLPSDDDTPGQITAEVEVMIAEERCRRKGFAKLALSVIMAYAVRHLSVHTFVAKIIDTNQPSIALFENVLKFKLLRRVPAFEEVHYQLVVDEQRKKQFQALYDSWNESSFLARAEANNIAMT